MRRLLRPCDVVAATFSTRHGAARRYIAPSVVRLAVPVANAIHAGFSAADARRHCASSASSSSTGTAGKGGRATPEPVVERHISDIVDMAILPLRHTLYSVNLWAVRQAFPGSWDAEEFFEGAPQAFRQITEHLDLEDRDTRPLSGLVSDELLEELRREAGNKRKKGSQGCTVQFQRVVDVRIAGVFTVSARADDTGSSALWITTLLQSVEEYAAAREGDVTSEANHDDSRLWHVHRIHKWTFKRMLPDSPEEEPGDWQVVAANKGRWQPPPTPE